MKRLVAVAIAALALSGPAGADVFKVVPSVAPSAPATLPSAELPNTPGSISFPATLLQRPAFVETRTYDQLFTLWQRNGTLYGVPWQVLAAINKIESNFGTNMGPSSAGAIGWMQFMPSTWERWGVDADGDGIANPWSPDDAIAAAARYLAASGGGSDISRAVFSYNHAQWYVDEVLQLAQSFGTGGLDATFNADPLQASFAQNTQAVADAKQQLFRAERTLRALSRRGNALDRRAASASLLSDRLALDQRAVRFGVRVDAARARVTQLQAELTKARQELAFAHDRALAASFSQLSAGSTAAPAYNGQYVFPVGGGPSIVSVSHHHHDYPAADIAAPEGSPDLRPRRCDRGRLLVDPERALRDRDDDRHGGRPGVDVLPHVVPRADRHSRRAARCRNPGRPRRDDRPCHRTAPAPAARPDDLVPAAPAVVPELRRRRLPLAGRRPDGLDRHRRPRAGLRGRPHHADGGFEWTGRALHPVGAHSARESSLARVA